ncbi:MAG: DUF1593 domain-containing protein [Tannerellaceae bacterium]|jgi:hypothetical protein|nr:DUF1593 domain-containing protein [Tannerellaceae bacterium]
MKTKWLLIIYFVVSYQYLIAQENQKNRVIVLTDIEADPDDTQSLVRLLLYSNQIDIKGLVATTSIHKKSSVEPLSIRRVIDRYGKVRQNLLKHESGFPNAKELQELVKEGLSVYGLEGVGEGKDSEGSNWIIKILEEGDERPLWISVWGGANTLAQALYKIDKTKAKKEAKRLISKLRVYTISDQDDAGFWIRDKFPYLFYIVSPGGDYDEATWPAINQIIKGIDNEVVSNKWIAENIQQGHGALGSVYPDVMWGLEGDTPAFLLLIPNGLNEPEHPNWGGWGGRYELYKPELSANENNGGILRKPETRMIWTNAVDKYTPYVYNPYGRAVKKDDVSFEDFRVTLWRWREDFQNDFAARMDWCIKSYETANHPPVPVLTHSNELTIKSGQWLALDASGSYDPDGDNLSYLWYSYPEVGSYKEPLIKDVEIGYRVYLLVPKVKKSETAHIILKVTDKGTPRLSRYERMIINLVP